MPIYWKYNIQRFDNEDLLVSWRLKFSTLYPKLSYSVSDEVFFGHFYECINNNIWVLRARNSIHQLFLINSEWMTKKNCLWDAACEILPLVFLLCHLFSDNNNDFYVATTNERFLSSSFFRSYKNVLIKM